jgi:hypothetical protein
MSNSLSTASDASELGKDTGVSFVSAYARAISPARAGTRLLHHSADRDGAPQWPKRQSRLDRLENDSPPNRPQRENQRRRERRQKKEKEIRLLKLGPHRRE